MTVEEQLDHGHDLEAAEQLRRCQRDAAADGAPRILVGCSLGQLGQDTAINGELAMAAFRQPELPGGPM